MKQTYRDFCIDHLLLHTLIDTSHLQLRVNGTSLPRDRPCLINYYSWRSNLCLHHNCTRCEFIDAFMPYEITIVQLPSCLIQVKCNLYYLLVGIFLADWFWKSGSYCNRHTVVIAPLEVIWFIHAVVQKGARKKIQIAQDGVQHHV